MIPDKEPFSLYIHIPYCAKKCPYCDFNVHVVPKIPERPYSESLLKELQYYGEAKDWRGRRLQSIYFGGGTPSTFSPSSIGEILERASSLFPFEKGIEINLEANPGRDDSANFSGYHAAGVNRLSLGVQSFQPDLLGFLGRWHTAEETREAIRLIEHAGFENFNLDLIYGSPAQSLSDLKADLEEALSFNPPHISAYNLTIEEGTSFYRDCQSGKMRTRPEEDEIAMAELIEETLSRRGLQRYEISNYARAGRRSRHNANYWQGGDYLGIGAGAHSYLRMNDGAAWGSRWHDEKHPGRYMAQVNQRGYAVVEAEHVDVTRAAAEFMLLGLRMMEGIVVDQFCARFGKGPIEFYPQIGVWLEEGLMEERNHRLRLTRRGLLLADSIFVDFM